MHSILFNLPCSLVCDLLTKWCSLTDVSRLDSSCTNLTIRSRYLEHISSSMVVFSKWDGDFSKFPQFVKWINRRSVSVTYLAVPTLFTGMRKENDEIVSSKNVARLKYLCLDHCADLTDSVFQAIVKNCRYLSVVSIGSDHHPCWVTDASLRHLANTTSVLKSFKIAQSALVSDVGIAFVCASNNGLLEIDIQKCNNVGERSISVIAKYCCFLQVLKFGNNSSASVACLAALLRNCSNLKEVSLKGFGASFQGMNCAEHDVLHHLQTLTLSSVSECTNLNLQSILARATNLQIMHLHDVKYLADEAVVGLDTTFTQLASLSLASCPRLTPVGIQALLQRCPALQEVRLHACNLTQAALASLAGHCPKVSVLSLTWCQGVNDAVLAVLLAQDRLPPLREVTINGCTQVTNVSLKAFVHFLPTLVALSVSYCPKITAEAVADVLTRHPELQVVR